jgi:hypothetical protein
MLDKTTLLKSPFAAEKWAKLLIQRIADLEREKQSLETELREYKDLCSTLHQKFRKLPLDYLKIKYGGNDGAFKN